MSLSLRLHFSVTIPCVAMAEDGTPSLSTIDRIRRGDPKLNVLNASLNDSDVADILPVLKGSNAITVIQIRMGGLTNVGARLIASLIADKMITTLDLRHNKSTCLALNIVTIQLLMMVYCHCVIQL